LFMVGTPTTGAHGPYGDDARWHTDPVAAAAGC
jgi:hypothetical protein